MATTISHTTKTYPKSLPYALMAQAILGASYELSLVFVGDTRARAVNQATRGKDYVPNVLSLPLGNATGEIYINPRVAKREAAQFGHTYTEHVGYLFIHGCVHLTGLDHGKRMDELEQRYCQRFSIPLPSRV